MRKILLSLMLCAASAASCMASDAFLLVDVVTNKTLVSEGNIHESFSPCSSFKIPIALMAYETGHLKNADEPLIKYVPEKHERAAVIEAHKQDMTPKKWMKFSAVWYSQELTPQIGKKKFKELVDLLEYGNRDVSGDPGKDNGLTHCWLGSSLEVTPKQQVDLMTRLSNKTLPFKAEAQQATREIIAMDEDMKGWKLFGKTGSGYELNEDGSKSKDRMHGWFVGWLEKGDQKLVFAYHKTNVDKSKGLMGGPAAKAEAIEKLRNLI